MEEVRLSTQLYSFQGTEAKNNVVVSVNGNLISLHINKDRIFETLFWRKEIVGAMNKKFEELLNSHLDKMAKEEEELRQGK